MPIGDFNPIPKNSFRETFKKNGRYYTFVKCDECEIEMERRTDQVNQRGTGNFCKPCEHKRTGDRVKGNKYNPVTKQPLNCKQCGKQFLAVKSKLDTRKFCSKKCNHDWHRDNGPIENFIKNTASGVNHPKYKHGRRVGKHGGSKPLLRKEIIERDGGHWCLLCGKPGPGLHMHRVIYGSQCGKYEIGNCVLLCGEHHGVVHSSKQKWQPFLFEYLKIAGTVEGNSWLQLQRGLIQMATE